MDIPTSKPNSDELSQARLAVITSTGADSYSCGSAANLSIALAKRGKHVCLITTHGPTDNNPKLSGQHLEASLEELLTGQKVLAEILHDGPERIQVLPTGNTLANFCHLDDVQQKLLIETLIQLEAAFDYLIIEITAEIDEGLLQLLRAAPLILLAITPDAASLTRAFSVLRALKRYYDDQPVHVIVGKVENLPNAHNTFKKLQHAASKYLQIEPQYVGFLPLERPLCNLTEQGLTKAKSHPDMLIDRYFKAITDRFCVAAEFIDSPTHLSNHFSEIHAAQQPFEKNNKSIAAPNIVNAEKREGSTPSNQNRPGQSYEELAVVNGLYDAVRYAGLLAESEARLEAPPQESPC